MSEKWDEARLQQYINDEEEESLTLDYKGGGALVKNPQKREEVTKDVSAMANSAGGIIIYGLAEGKTKATKHRAVGFVAVDRTVISKETLEHFIGNIRPKIDNVVVHPVELVTGPNDVAYVVDIPQSNTAHQATDKRYYKRYNFESVPMEDHEIRDVMGRGQYPKIELAFGIVKTIHRTQPQTTSSDPLSAAYNDALNAISTPLVSLYGRRAKGIQYELTVTASNVGSIYAQYVSIFVDLPLDLADRDSIEFTLEEELLIEDGIKYYQFRESNLIGGYDRFSNTHTPQLYVPLLPTLSRTWKFDLTEKLEQISLEDMKIKWSVYADNAPPIDGEIVVSEIEIVERSLKMIDE